MNEIIRKKLYQARELCRLLKGRLLGRQATFDSIYRNRTWAHKPGMLSGTGSYGVWSETYISFIRDFILKHNIRSITDIGCGDFNIGHQICPWMESYHALDVSGEIIRWNKARYAQCRNVTFLQADACRDSLPEADLVTVRQVFQHLTNAEIEAILRNIGKSACRYVLISEHLPTQDRLERPNKDLPYHGANIRVEQASGVMIGEPPFSRPSSIVLRIPSEENVHEELVVFLWQPFQP